jgi:hypothetical protein
MMSLSLMMQWCCYLMVYHLRLLDGEDVLAESGWAQYDSNLNHVVISQYTLVCKWQTSQCGVKRRFLVG